jgi:cytochrome c oxidase cbb3-type subunit 3
MSDGLSWYIIILTSANVLAMGWLIWWSGKGSAQKHPQGETMGHTWDGDLQEYNNPLPRWWLWLFYATIGFAVLYFALYPGLGKWQGLLGWSQEGQWETEMEQADEKYAPVYAQFVGMSPEQLVANDEAQEIGKRLYLNYCSMCHGSDARGARGFPNLADDAWLYGGDFSAIRTSIVDGRRGVMPAMAAAVGGEQGVEEITQYVLSLSGRATDPAKAEAGKAKYAVCMGCHGAEGKGNQAMGAPNLTDDAWVYGASAGTIADVIANGREGVMPAHGEFFGVNGEPVMVEADGQQKEVVVGAAKVDVLTAYVKSLSAQ